MRNVATKKAIGNGISIGGMGWPDNAAVLWGLFRHDSASGGSWAVETQKIVIWNALKCVLDALKCT